MRKNLKQRGVVAAACAALLVAVVVAAYAAVPSGASQFSVTPKQFAALNAKVTKLQARVTRLNKTVDALGTIVVTCVTYKALGISQHGVPPTEGYVYQKSGASQVTTALDAAPASSASQFLLTTPPQCASLIGTYSRAELHTGAHGSSRAIGRRGDVRAALSVVAATRR